MEDKYPDPKPKPSIPYRTRLYYYGIPRSIPRLPTPRSTATQALAVLLCYAAYLRQFSDPRVPRTSGRSFILPPLTSAARGKPANPELEVDSVFSSGVFLVEVYLAYLVLVLYLWPIWHAYKNGTKFSRFVFSCWLNWGLALLIYFCFLKLTQHYELA
ncbi:hypothetical protein F4859DRAFT_56714 [Xylaria cf. heliscus]|nr:hypothetical protein F4859DRAFT_56714 [Xylaria cf. heliscus]